MNELYWPVLAVAPMFKKQTSDVSGLRCV